MKKLLITTAFLLGLIAFLFFIPHFLKFDKIQDQITVAANRTLGMQVSIGEVSLHWFPYPHLFLGAVHAKNDNLSFDLPELRAVPDWRSLLYRQLVLGKIIIIEPALEIKNTKKQAGLSGFKPVGLDFDVEIKYGSLILPAQALSENIGLKKNAISNINAEITFENQRLKYFFSSNSSFCGEISSSGRIDFNNFYYRIDSTYKNFNLSKVAESVGTKICPIDEKNNFSAHLEGVTTKNFKLQLKGNIPAFQLLESSTVNINDEYESDISIEVYDDDFFIHLNKFKLNYPKINLNGLISRRNQKDTGIPIWNLDLKGQDLDLKEAREFVLALWGDNRIAQIVCNIVQGGKAKNARYVFNGPVSDFEYISKMKIWVDVENSPIFIPDINLQLDKATGAIAILDGVLTGENMIADISSSSGSNGVLLLDLKNDADAFQLDLDLDIDVANLKNVLANIVNEPGFLKEMTHFKEVTGRAKGHLSLGDNFDQLKTTVEVKEIKAEGIYDRLPWPFSIQSGSLNVMPGKTKWSSVKAILGPHHILNTTADVTWEDHAVINIQDFEADIDGESLFKEGTILIGEETYEAHNFLGPILTEIKGLIHIAKGQMSGPATAPKQWQYQANFTSDNVFLISEHLPEKVLLDHSSGTVNNDMISFSTDAKLLNDSFHLSAEYQHKNLTYWQGSTLFSGTVNQQLIDWLDSKKTIPSSYHLKTPLLADDIRLTTEGNSLDRFKLSGKIISDHDGLEPATLEFDINRLKNQFQNTLSFSNKKEAGKLVYNIWDSTPKKTVLTWKGELSSATFDSFFSTHPFTSGHLNGVFSLLSTTGDKNESSYSGYIEAQNLQWETKKGTTPFVIDSLLLSGNEDNIQISKSILLLPKGKTASVSGSIVTDTENLDINLKLSSAELSSESLNTTFSFFTKDHKGQTEGATPQSDIRPKKSPRMVNGKLKFSVDNFNYKGKSSAGQPHQENSSDAIEKASTDTASKDSTDKTYPWKNIAGEATFADSNVEIDFSSAQLCGIQVYGQWTSTEGESGGKYFLKDNKELSFLETLPCLGISQSIIEGDFSVESELKGNPENWQEGTFNLKSSNGIIRRMELLSKIFSVINFTELLTFRDLPDINTEGLQYNDLILESHIDQHELIIDKAFLKGKGLNLTGQGRMDLKNLATDFTVFVAPFKMLDSVVTSIPLVGRIIGGKKGAILTFPVKVEGPIENPSVTPLAPSAIGKATLDFITDTLTLPFAIFTPFLEDEEQKPAEESK